MPEAEHQQEAEAVMLRRRSITASFTTFSLSTHGGTATAARRVARGRAAVRPCGRAGTCAPRRA